MGSPLDFRDCGFLVGTIVLSSISVLLLGFLLGMRHATDADHVVAVTTIVSEECSVRRASGIGALWGIGHSITILLVGGAIIAFRLTIPPRLGLALEFSVSLMLIALGVITLARRKVGSARSVTRPVAVGVVHGLAGSAFIALFVLAAVPQTWLALVYLGLFAIGTIAGMAAITAAIAVPSALSAKRFVGVQRHIQVASGVVSLAFGLMLAHEGLARGLFAAVPNWTPR